MAKRRANVFLAVFASVLAALLGLALTPSTAHAQDVKHANVYDLVSVNASNTAGGSFLRTFWPETIEELQDKLDEYAKDYAYVTVNVRGDLDFGYGDDAITFNKGAEYTLNLNGHMINRSIATNDGEFYDGEVLCTYANLTINGGDKTIAHTGYLKNVSDGYGDGYSIWVWSATTTTTPLYGGLIAGGVSKNGGGGIHIGAENLTVTLNDVTVAGNKAFYNDGLKGHGVGGGILMAKKNCVLNLRGSTQVVYNYARAWGGGIASYGDTNTINLDATASVSYNDARNYGGGIYLGGASNQVNGSTEGSSTSLVKGNVAENDDGGGIYVNGKNSLVSGLDVQRNTAEDHGGGIYLNKDSDSVSGCIVRENEAHWGGGINYNNGGTLSGSTVWWNKAQAQGGGVRVDSQGVLSLSGVVIVKNNFELEDGINDSDVYLQKGSTSQAHISGNPSAGSSVGIYAPSNHEDKISNKAGAYDSSLFFSNTSDRPFVTWQLTDSSGNYDRWLRLSSTKGSKITAETKTVSVSNKTENEDGTATWGDGTAADGTYTGTQSGSAYSLITGYTAYPTILSSTSDIDIVYHYSDGFFDQDATTYNTQLATMSATLAMSAFGANDGNYGTTSNTTVKAGDYTNKFAHVKQLMSDIGIDDEDVYISDTFTTKPGIDTIACAIGQKKLVYADGTETGYTLVPIAIRGGGYESEWVSNVTLGTSGEAEGFASAANQVKAMVDSYISEYGLTEAVANGTVKFWVVGYSRAGATANLTAKRLIDSYGTTGANSYSNQVYGYTIEAPQGANITTGGWTEEAQMTTYASIHNIVNRTDPVTMVGPSQMGFRRYGVDHYLPGDTTSDNVRKTVDSVGDSLVADNDYWGSDGNGHGGSDYKTQRTKMLYQLAAIQPDVVFDDYFHLATLNLLTSQMWADYIEEKSGNVTQREVFLPMMLKYLQQYGYGNSKDANLSAQELRTKYADTEGTQEAARAMMQIVMGLSDTESTALINSMSGVTGRLSKMRMFWILTHLNAWNSDSASKRASNIDEDMNAVWDALMQSDNQNPGLGGYFDETQLATIKKSLWSFAWLGYGFAGIDYDTKTYDAGNTAMNLGTAMNISGSIILPHYWEVSLAWIRSYDNLYDSDLQYIKVNRDVEAVTPTVEGVDFGSGTVEPGTDSSSMLKKSGDTEYTLMQPGTLHLETEGQSGSAIYYAISTNGGKTYSSYMLYQNGIELKYNTKTCKIKVYSKYYRSTSSETTYTFTVNNNIVVTAMGGIDGTTQLSQTEVWEQGYTWVTAPDIDGYTFSSWTAVNESTGEDVTDTVLKNAATKQIRAFVVVYDYNITLTAHYVSNVDGALLTLGDATEESPLPATGALTLKRGDDEVTFENESTSVDASLVWEQQTDGSYKVSATIDPSTLKDVDGCTVALASTVNAGVKLTSGSLFAVPATSSEVNADGTLTISYVIQPDVRITEVTAFDDITAPYGTAFEDLPLPSVITGTATWPAPLNYLPETTVAVPIEWSDDGYDSKKVGERQELSGSVTGLSVALTIGVTIDAEVVSAPDAPTATLAEGNYTNSRTTGLACATEGAVIKYKVTTTEADGSSTTTDEATFSDGDAIALTEPTVEGETTTDTTRVYTITAWAEKTGETGVKAKSAEATFTYVIAKPANSCVVTIECYDRNSDSRYGYMDEADALLGTQSYIFAKGSSVSLTLVAPSIETCAFSTWGTSSLTAAKSSGNFDFDYATGGSIYRTLTVKKLTGDVTIRAYYAPIVSEVNLDLDAPVAGEALATELGENTTVTLATGKTLTLAEVESSYFQMPTITWLPSDTTAGYNTAYTATVSFSTDSEAMSVAGHRNGPVFKVVQGTTTVKVNGSEPESWSVDASNKAATVAFAATDKAKVTAVGPLTEITGVAHGTADEVEAAIEAKLPETVTLATESGDVKATLSDWEFTGDAYSYSTTDPQTLIYTATINYPDDVDQNGKASTVSLTAYVAAADQVATPVATVEGTKTTDETAYKHTATVELSCETDGAKVYYTTDGTEPTAKSQVYASALTITKTTTIKAVAMKDGMRASVVLTLPVSINNGYALTGTLSPSTLSGTITGVGTYDEGTTVSITAPSVDGYTFWKWEVTGDKVSGNSYTEKSSQSIVQDTSAASTTLWMPDCDVSLTACYKRSATEATVTLGTLAKGETFPTAATLALTGSDGGAIELANDAEIVTVSWSKYRAGGYKLTLTLPEATDADGVGVAYGSALTAKVILSSTKTADATVIHNADGRVTLTYVATATLTAAAGDQGTIEVPYGTSAEDLAKLLPATVAVKAIYDVNGATEFTEAVGVTWSTTGYDAKETSEAQILTGTLGLKSAGIEKGNFADTATIKVKVAEEVVAAPAAPKASVASGSYTSAQSVELSCTDTGDDVKIWYSLDGGTTKTQYTGAIDLAQPETDGSSTSYTLSAWAVRTGESGKKAQSQTVSYSYAISKPHGSYTVTVECRDVNNKDAEPLSTESVLVRGGEENLSEAFSAPSVDDEVFVSWESTSSSKIAFSDFDFASQTLTITKLTGDVTLTAYYKPVINEVNLYLDAPVAGSALATTVGEDTSVKITNTYTADQIKTLLGLDFKVEWTPEATTAAYNTVYTAKVSLAAGSSTTTTPQFAYPADGATVTLNGASTTARLEEGEDGLPVLYVSFPATSPAKVTGVEALDAVSVDYHDTAAATETAALAALPKTVVLKTEAGSVEASVSGWTLDGTHELSTDGYGLSYKGTISYPSTLDQNGQGDVVSCTVNVAAATVSKMPVASPEAGSYTEAQSVTLTAADGATIYYTTDGTDPTEDSAQYTGPISIGTGATSESVTVKAIAKETDKAASPVLVASYSFDKTHTLNVVNGASNEALPESGKYETGTQVAINAPVVAGYKFWKWEVSGTATVADPSKANTTVTTVASETTVTATYVKLVDAVALTLGTAESGTRFPATGTIVLTRGTEPVTLASSSGSSVNLSWKQNVSGGYTMLATIPAGTDSDGRPVAFADTVTGTVALASGQDPKTADVTKNADGSITISYTVEPTVTSVGTLTGITVPYGTAFDDLDLPETVLVKVSYGNGLSEVDETRAVTEWTGDYEGSYTGTEAKTYTLTGTVSGTEMTASIAVTVSSEVVSAPEMPTASYDETAHTVTLTADEGVAIYYTLAKNGTTEKQDEPYSTPFSLSVPEVDGATNTYTVKAYAVKTGASGTTAKSQVATFNYSITKPYGTYTVTIDAVSANDPTGKPIATQTVSVKGGEDLTGITLSAPGVSGYVFANWAEVSDSNITLGGDTTSKSRTVTKLTDDATVRAVYTPVVSAVTLDLAAPVAGDSLSTTLGNSTSIVVAGETYGTAALGTKNLSFSSVSWAPEATDGKAANNTAYTATVSLVAAAGTTAPQLAKAENVTVRLANSSVDYDATLTWDETTGLPTLAVSFPATAKLKVMGIEQLDDITFANGTSSETIEGKLPQTVTLNVQNASGSSGAIGGDSTYDASVTWTLVGSYDATSLEAQTLTYTGTISYPDYLDQNGQAATVTLHVSVRAADQVEAPVADKASGTYRHSATVTLTTATADAAIYYTTDGTTPSSGSTPYTEPITIASTTTLKAVAVKSGMRASKVFSASYTIDDRYDLTVVGGAEGELTLATGSYKAGTTVNLSAPAVSGYSFVAWTGAADGAIADASSAATTLTMPASDLKVRATYVRQVDGIQLTLSDVAEGETFPATAAAGLTRNNEAVALSSGATTTVSVGWQRGTSGGYTMSALLMPGTDADGKPIEYASGVTARVYFGSEVAEATATKNADGSVTVSYTVEPEVASVTDPDDVTVPYGTTADELAALLPSSVVAKVSYQGVGEATEARAVTWDATGFDGTAVGTAQSFTGAVDGSDTVTATIKVTVLAEVVDAPGAPTASPDGGNFSTAQTVELKAAEGSDDASIRYILSTNGTAAAEKAYSGAIELPEPEAGKTATYIIKAWAERTGASGVVSKSAEATFTYVISKPFDTYTVTVECIDVNYQALGATDQMVVATKSFLVQGGTDLDYTLIAPNAEDEVFMNWADVSDSNITLGGDTTSKSRTVTKLTSDVTLQAIYKPVVKSAVVELDVPKRGETLATTVGENSSVTVTKEFTAAQLESLYDLVFDTVTWIPTAPTDGNAAAGTTYTAVISLSQKDGSTKSTPQFAYSDEGISVSLYGSDTAVTARIEEGENGLPVLYVTFPATEGVPTGDLKVVRDALLDGESGIVTLMAGTYTANSSLAISAPVVEGYSFWKWEATDADSKDINSTVFPDDATSKASSKANTSITVPEGVATLTARYVKLVDGINIDLTSASTASFPTTGIASLTRDGEDVVLSKDANDALVKTANVSVAWDQETSGSYTLSTTLYPGTGLDAKGESSMPIAFAADKITAKIKLSSTQTVDGTVVKNADGSVTVSYTLKPTIESVTESTAITVPFNTAKDALSLPKTAVVKVDYGTVLTDVTETREVKSWTCDSYSATTADTYTFTGAIEGTDKTASIDVTVSPEVLETPKTPTASLASGNYSSAQEVTLSCATTDATIKYTLKTGDTTGAERTFGSGDTIKLTVPNSGQTVYTLTAWAEKTSSVSGSTAKSAKVSYIYVVNAPVAGSHTVTVECIDVNYGYSVETFSYIVKDGSTLTAPAATDEIFMSWDTSSLPDGVSVSSSNSRQLTIGRLTSDVKVKATYKPAVKVIDLDIDDPVAASWLQTDVGDDTSVTVTNTFSKADLAKMDVGFAVSWTATGQGASTAQTASTVSTAAYNTVYTAAVTLTGGSGSSKAQFGLNPNGVTVKLRGAEYPATIQADTDESDNPVYTLYITFPATEKAKVTGVTKPSAISVTRGTAEEVAAEAKTALPTSVSFSYQGSLVKGSAPVSWALADGSAYDESNLEPQTLTYVGTLDYSAYPDLLVPADYQTVTATVTVAGADRAATPTASPSAGVYLEDVSVRLSCATEGATIWYTTDGTDPATSNTRVEYTGSFEIPFSAGSEVVLKAMAEADGYRASETLTATYSFGGTLRSVENPDDVTGVANGTALDELPLPETTAIQVDGNYAEASVSWDRSSAASAYDPASSAEQTFTVKGTVTLPKGVSNPDGVSLEVEVKVTVAAANPIADDKPTLSFVTNGGSAIESVSFDAGTTVNLSAYVSYRDGYVLAGWYSDEALTNKVTKLTVNGDITVYAAWTEYVEPTPTPTPKPDTPTDPKDPANNGVADLLNTTDHVAFMTGYSDTGLFGPENTLTRAECAQIFYNLLHNKNVAAGKGFSDVADDAWYAKAVLAMQGLGIMNGVGNTGRFEPDRAITRAEFAAVCARFAKAVPNAENTFPDVADDAWYAEVVAIAHYYGWFDGVGSTGLFQPERSITRGEAAKVVCRVLGRVPDESYIDAHSASLRSFADVKSNLWSRYYIAEAANAHSYTKANGVETWK